MSNKNPDQPTEKPEKKKRQRHSDNWGGVREGAGRLPNEVPLVWLQLGVMLSDEEYERLSALDLSPGQRRHRLLNPDPQALGAPEQIVIMDKADTPDVDADMPRQGPITVNDALYESNVPRRQYNFRIVLESRNLENPSEYVDPMDQRRQILSIKQPERRRRLLTEPLGGDIEDDRPGRWQTGGKDK